MPYVEFDCALSKLANVTRPRFFFGSYPTQEEMDTLEHKEQVRHIFDLTCEGESIHSPYTKTTCEVVRFSINDHDVPKDWYTFTCFLLKVAQKADNCLIHCRGGHGRSGLVSCCLLCYKYSLHPEEAIEIITLSHQKRHLSYTWKQKSVPLNRKQLNFVYKFFSPIAFSKTYNLGVQAGFSIFSQHRVCVDGVEYENSERAYQALRTKLVDLDTMIKVQTHKFKQHPDLQVALQKTCLRPLFDMCKYSHCNNIVGVALQQVREELFKEPE